MAKIELTQGKVCLIDDQDFPKLSGRKWHAHRSKGGRWYAIGKIRGKSVKMHRFLLSPPDAVEVDHFDGNGLNNQRANLRISLHPENIRNQKIRSTNKSGFKGVYWLKRIKRWAASICAGRVFYLGSFKDKKDAAKAYDSAAMRLHGEFALTNKKLGLL